MKELSDRVKAIKPSATLAVKAKEDQLKAEGIKVIGFGTGEPDFNTPSYIKEAGIAAINANKTRYTPAAGTKELKQAICGYMKDEFNLDYKPENIVATSGAKHVIFAAFNTILNPGDEVILPVPCWVTYEELIRLAGGTPVLLTTTEEQGFKVKPEELEKLITPKTKAVILNFPCNPTGATFEKEELEVLSKIIIKHDLYVLSDEIYHALSYGKQFVSLASFDGMKERTIVINGVSKTFAMTGWRIGWAACDSKIAKPMSNLLSHTTGSPSTISQSAAAVAISTKNSCVAEMKAEFDRRRKYFVERVSKMDKVSCLEPDGAFYIFMNVKQLLNCKLYGEEIKTSEDFCKCLLEHAHIAVVPGIAFGMDGYVRWTYATSYELIVEALDRLEVFIKESQA